jgi:predicted acetyltransferase
MAQVFLSPAPGPAELEFLFGDTDPTRMYGAFAAGGHVVATYRSFATTTAVPGAEVVATSAVSAVTVAPTHRRQGLLTRMIELDLTASVERGDPLALLVAAEWPIYGRYGFGPAVDRAAYELDLRTARFRDGGTGGSGAVELVSAADALEHVRAVHDRARRSCPGSIERSDVRLRRILGLMPEGSRDPWQGQVALVRGADGQVEGYACWQTKGDWDGMRPRGTVVVDELVATSPAAGARLWRFLAEIDLVVTLTADMRPAVEPLAHLLVDGRQLRQTRREDFAWARLLDVPVALTARRYPGTGRVVLEVVDPQGWAAGRWALEADADGATCRRTTQSADLTLPVQTLSAAYLGGTRLRTLAQAGLLDEHTPGALGRADGLLGPLEPPWALTLF